MKKVLFVAVHPDDETLGCGGAILKHKAEGDEIYWLIITNISESLGYSPDEVKKRQVEIDNVAGLYGFTDVFKLDFLSTKLDQVPMRDLISSISHVINKVKPVVIYLPNRSDIHSDHQVAFRAAMSCTKNFRHPFIKRILMYETLSETEFAPPLSENYFAPNIFIDITQYLDMKLKIMRVYEAEIKEAPFPRSLDVLETLAKYRGSRIGVKYAESYMLLEEIV